MGANHSNQTIYLLHNEYNTIVHHTLITKAMCHHWSEVQLHTDMT